MNLCEESRSSWWKRSCYTWLKGSRECIWNAKDDWDKTGFDLSVLIIEPPHSNLGNHLKFHRGDPLGKTSTFSGTRIRANMAYFIYLCPLPPPQMTRAETYCRVILMPSSQDILNIFNPNKGKLWSENMELLLCYGPSQTYTQWNKTNSSLRRESPRLAGLSL